MTAPVDFAHTEQARRNRAAKAAALAAYCQTNSIGPEIVAAPAARQRAVCRDAGVNTASDDTWYAVADLLIDAEPAAPAAVEAPAPAGPAYPTSRSQQLPPGIGWCWDATSDGYCWRPAPGGYYCPEHRNTPPTPPPGTTLADLRPIYARPTAADTSGWPRCHACRTPVDPVVPLVNGRPEHPACDPDHEPRRRPSRRRAR
ncbi:hypothetical protein [Jiangella muralis]|uniref:hypothetical protein n=1 Tax=Jiangella muralis TaxID=702383 RepID=UPI00069ECF52|nr:hypothetical protein [Jiangella muralis]